MRAHVDHRVLRRAVDPRPDDALGERLARRVGLDHPGVLAALEHVGGRHDDAHLDPGVDPFARLVGPGRARTTRTTWGRPWAPAPGAAPWPRSVRAHPGAPGVCPLHSLVPLCSTAAGSCGPDIPAGSRRYPTGSIDRVGFRAGDGMALRVVGAGLGRTGTHSLKLALEQLLGGPCYHMIEVFGRPDDIPVWHGAVEGESPDWSAFLADYVAAVDWPRPRSGASSATRTPTRSCCCRPDRAPTRGGRAPTTPSSRSPRARSRRRTAACSARSSRWRRTCSPTRSHPTGTDETAAKRAYEQHNADVRARHRSGTADRLAAGRRLGTDLRGALAPGARRTVPAREHHRRLPGHGGPRQLR